MSSAVAKTRLIILGGTISICSIFQMGYSNAYVNTAIGSFRDFLNASVTDRGGHFDHSTYTLLWSAILNAWFPGFAIGSWLAVPLTDTLGRKRALLLGNLLTLLSITVMTTATVFEVVEMLLVGRFVSAISSGIAMCALILFLQEVSPTDIRGTMSFFAEVAFVLTNTVGGVLGMSSILGNRLPHLVGFAVLPTIVAIIVLIPLHETPKFLLLKKRDEVGAVHAIQFYQKTDASATEDVLKAVGDERDDTAGSWRDLLLVPHLRAGLLLGIVALQLTTSIWTMVYYSTEFLRRANIDYDLADTVATLTGTAVIERFSRRGIFLSASIVNLTAILLFTICSQLQPLVDSFKYGCILAVCLHGISYSFATGPIAWFITAELVSTRYRSACQSVALSLNHIVAMFLTFAVLPLYNLIDSWSLIPLFVIPGYLCLLYLYKRLPETKGRDIQEVIEVLKGADGDDGPQEHVAMKSSGKTDENAR